MMYVLEFKSFEQSLVKY